jgi:GT2 family glycosyltransferase
MVQFAESSEKIGIVGGQLINKDGSPQRSFAQFYHLPQAVKMLILGDKGEMNRGKVPHVSRVPQVPRANGKWKMSEQSGDLADHCGTAEAGENGKSQAHVLAVDWVSGGFLLIRKNLFEEAGGFDERFFMYMEDMELCYRVKQMGYTIYGYSDATALHSSQGSSSRSFAVEHIYKGLEYFYKKHKSTVEYSILRAVLTAKAVLLIVVGKVTGNTYLKKTYSNALKTKNL